jgi:hypothetical protein
VPTPRRSNEVEAPGPDGQYAYADLSQSISRSPWSLGAFPCLTTGSSVFAFQAQCIIRGAGCLQLMGWPQSRIQLANGSCSSGQMRTMAAEAMHIPSLASAMWAFYLNPEGPWWQDRAELGGED